MAVLPAELMRGARESCVAATLRCGDVAAQDNSLTPGAARRCGPEMNVTPLKLFRA